jgi:hypothetical protein
MIWWIRYVHRNFISPGLGGFLLVAKRDLNNGENKRGQNPSCPQCRFLHSECLG